MNKKAFTLIELLVVVLIIGILAAIALPQYTVAVEKSRASEALINLKYAQQAYELQYLQDPTNSQGTKPQDFMELSGGNWDSDSNQYCTNKFSYDMTDFTNGVSAIRCTPMASCQNCTKNTREYDIIIGIPQMGEGWEASKRCVWFTDLGYKVCKNLEGQGFETEKSL